MWWNNGPCSALRGTVLMALAFTQVTGKVGVATITQGPGLTNYVTGSGGGPIIVEL